MINIDEYISDLRKKISKKDTLGDKKMKLLGFNSYEEFSNQLNTDNSFRHFVYDFLKESL